MPFNSKKLSCLLSGRIYDAWCSEFDSYYRQSYIYDVLISSTFEQLYIFPILCKMSYSKMPIGILNNQILKGDIY